MRPFISFRGGIGIPTSAQIRQLGRAIKLNIKILWMYFVMREYESDHFE